MFIKNFRRGDKNTVHTIVFLDLLSKIYSSNEINIFSNFREFGSHFRQYFSAIISCPSGVTLVFLV